ncbi:protein AIR1/2 [Geosmithia morbida]|uniref:Protein AIR1/2 n=1 Tax=Geosmithia morbida TaxID=1094350 RepID=A0A9P5D8P1_9HYPO|nr:protein AIR1/2 [Geosmithia morbida]KAF4125719.1 protein AIR1/2 [Geosmithia morbida]
MASQDEPLGDVINLSSSDDDTPSHKHSLQESDSSESTDSSSRRRKRIRTASAPGAHSAIMGTPDTGAEEGEIEDDSTMAHSGISPPAGEQAFGKSAAASCVFMPKDPLVFEASIDGTSVDFNLPVFSQKPSITASVVAGGYNFYLDQSSGIRTKKKKSAKQSVDAMMNDGRLKTIVDENTRATDPTPAAASATAPQSDDDEYEPKMDTVVSETSSQHGSGDAGNNGEAPSQLPVLSEGEVAQLRRYFPSAKDPTNMCLLCGGVGHTSANCSKASCKFCDSPKHWSYACPTRVRCGNCRQLGHTSSVCTERLALTKDEGLACCFCGSPGHLEDDCTEIWRSFVPTEDAVRTVTYIAPSCSVCGSGSHYEADCDDRRGVPANPTWSLKNHDRYVDQDCEDLAIEGAVAKSSSAKTSRAPAVRVRGHAARTDNIIRYSESDDSDVEFLGKKPVQKAAPRAGGIRLGQLRMASNIEMPSGTMNDQPQAPLSGQPPVPPGLPPRLDSGRRRPPTGPARGPRGDPTSLPSKPPPAAWGQRNAAPPSGGQSARGPSSRGGQRGERGGGGGGGGFRGRGRGGGRGRGRGGWQ